VDLLVVVASLEQWEPPVLSVRVESRAAAAAQVQAESPVLAAGVAEPFALVGLAGALGSARAEVRLAAAVPESVAALPRMPLLAGRSARAAVARAELPHQGA
jgi:hypothetical protein